MSRIDYERWHLTLKDSYEKLLREERIKSKDADDIENYFVSPTNVQYAAAKKEFLHSIKEYIDQRVLAARHPAWVSHSLKESGIDDAFRRFLLATEDEQFDANQRRKLVDCFWRIDAWIKSNPTARAALKRTWNKLKRQYGINSKDQKMSHQ